MLELRQTCGRLFRDESGATAIEYGLLAALIGVGSIAAFGAFGGGLSNLFDGTADKANVTLDGATGSL